MSFRNLVEEMGVTRALAHQARRIKWQEIGEDAREVARHCLLDFLGVGLAGTSEPLVKILVDSVVRGEGSSQASLIGRKERATELTAALVNGAAVHALDFDDTHLTLNGHPSVPVLSALLPLCESSTVSGEQLLEAVVAGVEFECRLAAIMGLKHYTAGFHATGTLGTFGAAAACAQLLHLDEQQWLNTLGLAGTQAAGLKSGFGTMAKPLHAGRAGSAGLLSAKLAAAGFTANPGIVEVAQGFAATHCGEPLEFEEIDSARQFEICGTLFKYHAACYLTHAAIEAAASIRAQHSPQPDAVSSIEALVSPVILGVCNIPRPSTGLEGKFSIRTMIAAALLGYNTGDPALFTDAQMNEPRLVALRDRVTITPVEDRPESRVKVLVQTRNGRFEAEADSGEPATDLAGQRERLLRKFNALATPVLGASQARSLADAALGADRAPQARQIIRMATLA